jgi:hypothetical protein
LARHDGSVKTLAVKQNVFSISSRVKASVQRRVRSSSCNKDFGISYFVQIFASLRVFRRKRRIADAAALTSPLTRRDAIPLAPARLPHAPARSPREASHLRGTQAHPGGSWPGAAERAIPRVDKTRASRSCAQISRQAPRRDFAPGIAGSLSQLGDVRL